MTQVPTNDDKSRLSQLDRLINEMESTITVARETTARMTRFLREAGIEDKKSLMAMVGDKRCSPAMKNLAQAELDKFHKELKADEQAQMINAGRQQKRRRHRNRKMLRI